MENIGKMEESKKTNNTTILDVVKKDIKSMDLDQAIRLYSEIFSEIEIIEIYNE